MEGDKTILHETSAEVVGLSTRKHQDWFDKADKKVQESCLKRNAPATIICLQNLMIKLPRLHTRLPAVHSRPSLGPCRMIGGQDFPRGHNGMLTWMTCSFCEALKAVQGPSHQIQSPLRSFGWKYPADRQGSHSPALVRAFQGPLQ